MRWFRLLSLLAALSIAFAAIASAECGWVLWEEKDEIDVPMSSKPARHLVEWRLHDAYEEHSLCERAKHVQWTGKMEFWTDTKKLAINLDQIKYARHLGEDLDLYFEGGTNEGIRLVGAAASQVWMEIIKIR